MLSAFKLSGPVGANVRIKKDDTLQTKRALQRLGFLEPSESISPVADDAMIEAIKAFQKENRITKDGAMKPAGPTERLIQAALFEGTEGANAEDALAFRIGGAVGTGGANRPEDVLKAKRALSLAGIIPAGEVNGKMADRTFSGAIEAFQRDFNLKRNSRITPGDETERALARVIRPAMGKGGAGKSLLKETSTAQLINNKNGTSKELNNAEKSKKALGVTKVKGDEKSATSASQLKGGAEIDKSEQKFRALIPRARDAGAHFAADMLEHFLSKEGGTKDIGPGRLRSIPIVLSAEKTNIERFNADWLRKNSLIHQTMLKLKDGESLIVERRTPKSEKPMSGDPVWDRLIKPRDADDPAETSNLDLFFGSGNSTLHSEGKFRVTRKGSMIHIEGEVEHEWKDDYDWDAGKSVFIPDVGIIRDEEGKSLEANGRGKSFKMRSMWRQPVNGTIEIRDGKLASPRIRWDKPE